MNSEDIQAIVNAKEELELGRKVAANSTNDSEDDGSPGSDETSTRGNSDEARNGTGAESDRGPLLLEAVVEQHPGHTTDTSSEVGVEAGHDSTDVGCKGRTAVEAEPTDPEEHGAKHNMGDIVGTVGETVNLAVTGALAEHQGVGESGGTGGNVDGSTSGKVEGAEGEQPAVAVPGPVSNRVVDDGGPDEGEDHRGENATTVGDGTKSEGGTFFVLVPGATGKI